MKFDLLLSVIVVALTLVMPFLGYINTADQWVAQSAEARKSAARFEELAKQIEAGKNVLDQTGFPTYLRMQARGELALAAMYTDLSQGLRSLLAGSIAIAIVQALLLLFLYRRRSGITLRSSGTPQKRGAP
jgi:hypothetical protein